MRWAAAYAISAYVSATIGAGLLLLFIMALGCDLLPRDAPSDGPLPWLVNLGLLVIFAVQHSVMARRSFKQWITRWLPAHLERSTYVIASGIVSGVMPLLWQPLPGEPIWHGPIGIIGISLVAALATSCCILWFAPASFLGYEQATRGIAEVRGPLRVDGPYRFVRHPLMLGLLVTIWAMPVMKPELLMLNAGLTVYVLVAIQLEERNLVGEFGEEYERYRARVPALLPYRIFGSGSASG